MPALTERFGYGNPMEVPRLVKIGLNMGVGDAKTSTPVLEAATEQLGTISGQHPNVRRAKKSIANFKLREGMPVGVAVTLRGARMWEFLDRLITIAIPRIRDFRGLNPRSFDGRGNYSMGVREQLIFPEIDYDSIDEVRGLDVDDRDHRQDRRGGLRAASRARACHSLRRAGPAPWTPRRPRRRSAATRRPACGPRPRRRPSSSSRPRTPTPTPSRRSPRRARKARTATPTSADDGSDSSEESE